MRSERRTKVSHLNPDKLLEGNLLLLQTYPTHFLSLRGCYPTISRLNLYGKHAVLAKSVLKSEKAPNIASLIIYYILQMGEGSPTLTLT